MNYSLQNEVILTKILKNLDYELVSGSSVFRNISRQGAENAEHKIKRKCNKIFRDIWKYNFWPKCREDLYVETESYRTLMTLCNPKAEMPFAHAIVLHGPPGSGKTTVAKRLILQWTESKQTQMFPFAFYICCREINHIDSCTFINLLCKSNITWSNYVVQSLALAEKLLFVVDGLDELKAPAEALIQDICADWNTRKPVAVLLGSLLKRKMIPHATLVVTTQTENLGQIQLMIDQPFLIEIKGFSEQEKFEYFQKFFDDPMNEDMEYEDISDEDDDMDTEGNSTDDDNENMDNDENLEYDYMEQESHEQEGHEQEGHEQEGHEQEGHEQEGHEQEGHEQEGHEQEGHEEEGHEEEGHKEENDDMEDDNKKKALRAFKAVSCNASLLRMASLPAACVVFCICLDLGMKKGEDLDLTCQSHTSMFLNFICRLFSPETYEEHLKVGLKIAFRKTCILAANTLLEQKLLFCKKDLLKVRLKMNDMHPFDCRNVIDKSATNNYTSFYHPSIQKLLAAIMFVQKLERQGKRVSKYSMQNMLSREARLKNPNLSDMLLFVFGLLNETRIQKLRFIFDCQISIGIKRKFLQCESGENKPFLLLMDLQEVLSCLYESQEEGFVKEAMALFEEISLHLKTNVDLIHASFCLKNSQNLQTMSLQVAKGIFIENDAALEPTAQIQMSQDNQPMQTCWADFCDMFHSNEKLVFLDISESFFSSSSLQILYEKLFSAPCHLQKVVLKNLSPADAYKKLCLIFCGYETLSHLTLKGDNLSNMLPLLSDVIKHPECNLKYLSLSSCPPDMQEWGDFFQALEVNQSLTCLDLADNKLLDKGIRVLCKTWNQPNSILQKVSLENCHLTESCCKDISSILMISQGLTHLNLSKNILGDNGLKILCESLSFPECKLQTLVLWSCGITKDGCFHLSKMLRQALNLKHLDLGLNCIGEIGARCLCDALEDPPGNLESLWLCGCSMTPENCRDISKILRKNKSLNTLDLAQNTLGTNAVKIFCEDLKLHICPLQTLKLKFDYTNPRIQKLIQEMKESHPQLTIKNDRSDPKENEPSLPHFIF